MTRKEIDQKILSIKNAIEAKEYRITYDEANNICCYEAPDGSCFYVVVDMDSARNSNYFGSNTLDIAEESFTCELEWGEWESDFFDEINNSLDSEDADSIIDELKDLLRGVSGFLTGEHKGMDEQIEAYCIMNNCKIENYYWCEDYDKPMNVDDFIPINENNLDVMEYDGTRYYIVDNNSTDSEIIAVSEKQTPDCYGKYETVRLHIFEGKITGIRSNDEKYNSTDECLE